MLRKQRHFDRSGEIFLTRFSAEKISPFRCATVERTIFFEEVLSTVYV